MGVETLQCTLSTNLILWFKLERNPKIFIVKIEDFVRMMESNSQLCTETSRNSLGLDGLLLGILS